MSYNMWLYWFWQLDTEESSNPGSPGPIFMGFLFVSRIEATISEAFLRYGRMHVLTLSLKDAV